MRALRTLLLGGTVFFGLACAKGSTDSQGGFAELGSGGAGGLGSTDGPTSTDTSTSTSGPGPSSTTSGGQGGATTGSGGAGGESSTTSSTSTTGSGGAPPACDYTSPNSCAAPDDLGAIDGDQNNDKKTASGSTSKWFKIKVNEAVSSVISYPPLSYTASLDSPPGMQFDLYVYTGSANATNCQAVPKKGAGSPESVSAKWGDNIGTDDTTIFSVEVRYVSGSACDANATWNLTVAGHTMP